MLAVVHNCLIKSLKVILSSREIGTNVCNCKIAPIRIGPFWLVVLILVFSKHVDKWKTKFQNKYCRRDNVELRPLQVFAVLSHLSSFKCQFSALHLAICIISCIFLLSQRHASFLHTLCINCICRFSYFVCFNWYTLYTNSDENSNFFVAQKRK